MSIDYSSTIFAPTAQFGDLQDVQLNFQNALIKETTDAANTNFVHLNNVSGQIITTPLQLNPLDGDPDDNTTNAYNNNRVATRKWCKNAYITNVLDPHISSSDYTSTGTWVFNGNDVRFTADPPNNNSLTRKAYVDAQVATRQPLIGGSTTLTCGSLSSASFVDNGAAVFSNTVTFNGNVVANSSNVTPVQISYLKSTTSDIQTQLNGKQPIISGASALLTGSITVNNNLNLTGNIVASSSNVTPTQISYLKNTTSDIQTQLNGKQAILDGSSTITCGTLTSASFVDNGNAVFSGTVTFSGNVIANSSNITPTQLSYLDATSSIQTQLNGKQATLTSGSVGDSMLSSTFVKTTTDQTVGGVKTFSAAPIMSGANISSATIADSSLVSTFVKTSTDQTIGGIKTFSIAPIMSGANISSATVADSSLVSTFVKTSTDQTIGGVKTFSIAPIMSGANISASTIATSAISSGPLTVTSLTCSSETDSGNLTAGSISEKYYAITTGTNSFTLDYTTGGVFYLSTGSTLNSNFSIRLNNCGTDSTKSITFALIYATTGKYYCTSVSAYSDTSTSITLASSTPLYANGTPSISSSTVMIQTFTLVRTFGSSYVLSGVVSYY